MAQATLDEDDLFGEAATEMEADVREAIASAREALPDAETIWSTDAKNIIGVLNGLRADLEVDDARTNFREARKWFTIGERAGAFDADGDLAGELEEIESTIAVLDSVNEDVGALISTLPDLREQLD